MCRDKNNKKWIDNKELVPKKLFNSNALNVLFIDTWDAQYN